MFEELKALVVLADTGSMEKAAAELYVTPSALTRRIQRLELELGAGLLDRHFKPPKLTPAGLEVLRRSRAILSSVSDLRSSTNLNSPPTGPFRLGLSHALVQPDFARIIIDLLKQFPLLQPNIGNDVSRRLLERLHTGELDAALVVLPAETALPLDLDGVTLAREDMRLIEAQSSAGAGRARSHEFYRRNWVLNPAGCLVREELKNRVERLGARLSIAAELYNPELQLELVAGDVGVGMVRACLLNGHPLRKRLRVIKHPNFLVSIQIALLRGRHLGARAQVALELQGMLVKHFICSSISASWRNS